MIDTRKRKWSAAASPGAVTIERDGETLGTFSKAHAARLGRALLIASELTEPEGKRSVGRIGAAVLDELFAHGERASDPDLDGEG